MSQPRESWYARNILPRVIDLGCGAPQVAEKRQDIVPQAEGLVVEIGLGSGRNLPYYDAGKVSRVIGVDPSDAMLDLARKRSGALDFELDLRAVSGEALPLETGEADCLVCTFSLCTIPDPGQALAEMRRVLKPGGRLLFAEHGASPDAGVKRWQDRMNGLWGRIAGGCHLNRPILALIEGGGFQVTEQESGYLKGSPKMMSYVTTGSALVR
ncbi:MAG: class I SAM-dependent methyltransferase [Pseudomonadota bacterium]